MDYINKFCVARKKILVCVLLVIMLSTVSVIYAQGGDSQPPVVNFNTLNVTPQTVSVGESITISATVTDNLTSVVTVHFLYRSPSGNRYMTFGEYNDEDGLLSVNFSETKLITGVDENGVWELQVIHVQDKTGNSRYYERNNISNPSQYDFTVNNPAGGDSQPPVVSFNTLTANSTNPDRGVEITSTTDHHGITPYTKSVIPATTVSLTAPEYYGSGASRKSFSNWSGAISSTDRTINLTMSANRTVTANYVNNPDVTTPNPPVVISPPSPPILVSPANEADVAGSAVTFSWNASAGAERYHLQVSTVSNFSSNFITDNNTLTANAFTQSGMPNDGTTFYWRVRAYSAAGDWGNWSAGSNFVNKANLGDITGNGKIDVEDTTLVMQHVLSLKTITANQQKAADVNGDGKIDILDVVLIMKKALGLINKFPIE
jgi:hypothetical protein